MVSAFLLPILVATAAGTPEAVAAPQVQVWLGGGDQFVRGDKVRVYVKAEGDGYLVVLHAEPDGRVHVLFPLDPGDDNYVRTGKTYEVRGRNDRDAFQVYDTRGAGVVYAAFSADPFQFGGFALNGHWDYRAQAFQVGEDAEADLTDLAQQLAGASQFTYDLVQYNTSEQVARGSYDGYDGSYYGSYYGGWYRPWHSGLYFGISIGSPGYGCWACGAYYDPWYYAPWYDPFYYSVAYAPYYYHPYYYYPYGYRPYYAAAYYGYYPRYGSYWDYGRSGRGYRPGLAFTQQRYAFNYVQPGRRTLSLYSSGRSVFLSGRRPDEGGAPGGRVSAAAGVAVGTSGRRLAMPEATDGGRVAGPRRIGGVDGVQPRLTQPRPLEASPRATPRRGLAPVSDAADGRAPGRDGREGRRATSPGLVPLRGDQARSAPSRDLRGAPTRGDVRREPVRSYAPTRGDVRREPAGSYVPSRGDVRRESVRSYEPSRSQRTAPRYERSAPERRSPPAMSRPSTPRMSAPPRASGPGRASAPSGSRGGGRAPAAPRRHP